MDRENDQASKGEPLDEALGDENAQEIAFKLLDYEVQDDVGVITINRPEALNALNADLVFELLLALELAEMDISVRAVVITGTGRTFVAGADIANLNKLESVFSGREAALDGQHLTNSVAALQIPTVAAINGFALGGGLELALACDLRVASKEARMGLPEVGLGLIPGYGGTQRLPRLIGQGRALDLILTGRHVKADEALALGLVNRVVDDALAGALELARQIVKNAPVALGLAKEAVARGLDVSLSQGLEIEADLFGLAVTTEDATEGTAAFLEKRAAQFKGQ
jgi:enoyl-CoA hydratase